MRRTNGGLPALASEQCGTGDPTCPCVFSYAGFNVSNLDADGHLIVELSGEQHDYGPAYGLGVCAAHDSSTPPYCDISGAPSWCSSTWCYVNGSTCNLTNAASSYLSNADGLHYSYATCAAEDSFTTYYTQREGVLRLCSVFAEAEDGAGAPCGNGATHLQVEVAAEAQKLARGSNP